MSDNTTKINKVIVTTADGKKITFAGSSIERVKEVLDAWKVKIATIKSV